MWGINPSKNKSNPEESVSKSKRKSLHHPKGRSLKTYLTKIRKAKKFYQKLFDYSTKKKEKEINPKRKYFYEVYPTWDFYLKLNPIKESNIK